MYPQWWRPKCQPHDSSQPFALVQVLDTSPSPRDSGAWQGPARQTPYLPHTGSPRSPRDRSKQKSLGGPGRSRRSCRALTGIHQLLQRGETGSEQSRGWRQERKFGKTALLVPMSLAALSPPARKRAGQKGECRWLAAWGCAEMFCRVCVVCPLL